MENTRRAPKTMNRVKKIISAAACLLMGAVFFSASARSSVQQEMDALKTKFSQNADPAKKQDYEKGIAKLKSSGILQKALNIGGKAPDFTLPNVMGDPVQLYKMLKKGPVVLVWYRGGWSPYCSVYLDLLQEALPEFKKTGAELVAISPEMPNKAFATRDEQGLQFEVVSDIGSEVAKKFGIAYDLPDYLAKRYKEHIDLKESNGSQSNTLPLTAVYVINTEGMIAYAFLDADYRNRPEPATLISEVKKLFKK